MKGLIDIAVANGNLMEEMILYQLQKGKLVSKDDDSGYA